jgi:phage gp16-like protein
MSATANRARFAPNPHRRAMLAKVHLGVKELGMIDDDYRAILIRIAGVTSAGDCTDAQLADVIEELKAKGFRPKVTAGKPRQPKPADHAMAGKARAMWISLHQLGAIDNPSERALEGFAQRQLGVERLQWADQRMGYKLIEALKAMAERHGWSQDTANVERHGVVLVLKLRLAQAIFEKLQKAGLAPADWNLTRACWSLLGMKREPFYRQWDLGELDVITRGLGEKLREGVRQ